MMGKKEKKKRKKKIKKIFDYFIIILIPLVISIITVKYTIIENDRNEQALEPKFSLEKKLDKDGFLTWKIYNLGGVISNANIYATMHVEFSYYDEKRDEDIDVNIELPDYYMDCYYSNKDGIFYVKDDKQSALDNFSNECINLLYSNGVESPLYGSTSYFTLNYKDYKGDSYNRIYILADGFLIEDNSDQQIYNENIYQIKEIDDMPKPDIIVPLESKGRCVIQTNYKNATTQQPIDNEQEYYEYLFTVILDLAEAKNKPIEEMYGESILSNGNLWIRNIDTGELVFIEDEVEDFGYTE